jgi:glycosyltransferase involved in cell wall biosynthesis
VSTTAVEDDVRELYGAARIARVPFGVPPLAAGGDLPAGVTPPYVLAINTIDVRKRHEHLVRAFGSIATCDPELRLVIAGADGNAKSAVERAISALPAGLARRVVLAGRVDEATRAALIRNATVLAYPSADEGFGFPVLEAMAASVPVVASMVGGLPEVAGDAALLVAVDDDPGELAHALRRIVTDAALRVAQVERGRTRAAEFSWARHAAGMADLWRRAAE